MSAAEDIKQAEAIGEQIASLGAGVDRVSDLFAEIVSLGFSHENIATSSGIGLRTLGRQIKAAKVRAALRSAGVTEVDAENIGVTAYNSVKTGDAEAVKAAIVGGATLTEAIAEVNGNSDDSVGVFISPGEVFKAVMEAAGDPLPLAFYSLTAAVNALAFDTNIEDLKRGGATISQVIDGLLKIETHLQEMEATK